MRSMYRTEDKRNKGIRHRTRLWKPREIYSLFVCLKSTHAQGNTSLLVPNPSKLGGETMLRFEQKGDGYYLLTYEENGVTLQKVFCEPSEEVKISDLKEVEKPEFRLEIK